MFEGLKSIDKITGWDDVHKIASFKKNKIKFIIVYKETIKGGQLPMATFLNTMDKLEDYVESYDYLFFITNGRFCIDHINALENKDILKKTFFIQEEVVENAIDSIEHYISSSMESKNDRLG